MKKIISYEKEIAFGRLQVQEKGTSVLKFGEMEG